MCKICGKKFHKRNRDTSTMPSYWPTNKFQFARRKITRYNQFQQARSPQTNAFIASSLKKRLHKGKRKGSSFVNPSLMKRLRAGKRKAKGGKWIRAIKMLNRSSGKFCIPKKGSKEYARAKVLMSKM